MAPTELKLDEAAALELKRQLAYSNAHHQDHAVAVNWVATYNEADLRYLHQKHPEVFHGFHNTALQHLTNSAQSPSLFSSSASQAGVIRFAGFINRIALLKAHERARKIRFNGMLLLAGSLPRDKSLQTNGELKTLDSKWRNVLTMLQDSGLSTELNNKCVALSTEMESLQVDLRAMRKPFETEGIPGVKDATEMIAGKHMGPAQAMTRLYAELEQWKQMVEWLKAQAEPKGMFGLGL